ncbi:MAG: signal peptide peptidase SppA, partial [Mycobacterium sp.]
DIRIISYPGSSLLDMVRPRASSQPAAVSLPDALGALLGRTVAGILQDIEKTLSGANVLWLGKSRF